MHALAGLISFPEFVQVIKLKGLCYCDNPFFEMTTLSALFKTQGSLRHEAAKINLYCFVPVKAKIVISEKFEFLWKMSKSHL